MGVSPEGQAPVTFAFLLLNTVPSMQQPLSKCLMDEILIGNCICNFIFRKVGNKLFYKCSVIGNFQNMGNMKEKRHLKGFWEAMVRGLGGGVEEEGYQEEK